LIGKSTNVNKFLSLFGETFKAEASAEIAANPDLGKAAKDFLELGNLRNCIVHQNYATYVAEKSASEIFELFLSAERFLEYSRAKLAA
jgi:hypothetical protein